VSEPLLGHQVVGFDGGFDIIVVNTASDTHQHVLRPFHHFAVELEQVATLWKQKYWGRERERIMSEQQEKKRQRGSDNNRPQEF
jgi:hypothetical protein